MGNFGEHNWGISASGSTGMSPGGMKTSASASYEFGRRATN